MAGKDKRTKEQSPSSQSIQIEGSENVSVAQTIKTYFLNIPRWVGIGLIFTIAAVGLGIWYLVWSTQIFQSPMGGGLNILVAHENGYRSTIAARLRKCPELG